MPEREKSFIRKVIESLALKLILFVAGLGGAAVLTWYTAHSAWIHGIPGYEVGLITAAVFALCAVATYFFILAMARVPLRNAPAGSFLEPQENWLREVAERDRLELHNAVFVTECKVREILEKDNLHVVFEFSIRNGSVYSITVDPNIKGFIGLWDGRLSGSISASSLPHNLQHGWTDSFQIRQELTPRNLAQIKEMDSACQDQGYYDFGNLHITLQGNSPSGDALPARLRFKRVTRRPGASHFFDAI